MEFSIILDLDKPFPLEQFLSSSYVSECSVMISKKWLQEFVLHSFKSLDDLERQFRLDGHRSNLFLFQKKTNIQTILCYLLSHYTMPDPLMAFYTQGLFAPVFEWIMKSLPEHFYLGECDPDISPLTPLKTIGQSKKISFYLNHTSLTITKWLRIFTFIENDFGEEVVQNRFYIYFKFKIPIQEDDDVVLLELELFPSETSENC